MRLFAPLYLSNECINNCRYCGFSRDNPILRVTLSVPEVVREAKEQLGPQVIGVVTKWAIGRNAAITLSPAVVRRMLADAAAVAVRRATRGEFKPFALARPLQIEFSLRRSYTAELIAPIDTLTGFRLEKTGDRTYRFVTADAREMARLLDAIELVVLR